MNVQVNGPKIYFKLNIGSLEIPFTETMLCMLIISAFILIVCLWLASGLKKVPKGKQVLAEWLVNYFYGMVEDTMGRHNLHFAPYIGTLFMFSIIGSLSSLVGLRPYTANLSVTLTFALMTTVMVWFRSIKTIGFKGWLKSFAEPVPVILPINIISEVANPISMAFRHFGNIAAGTVITALVYGALAGLSGMVLGWIPNDFIANIPILQLGLPAILSIYFDLFSGYLQAFIICTLTMVYVGGAGPEGD